MSTFRKMLSLFTTFFKIGLFTFGGGYAMIPLIEREAAEKHRWIEEDEILEIVALAESTPGPIAVNAATFIGCRQAGFLGAFAATFGVVLPSFSVLFLVSLVYDAFAEARAVRYAFFGIRACVVALILRSVIRMAKKCKKSLPAYLIAAGAFAVSVFTDLSAVLIVLAAAVTGLVLALAARKEAKS